MSDTDFRTPDAYVTIRAWWIMDGEIDSCPMATLHEVEAEIGREPDGWGVYLATDDPVEWIADAPTYEEAAALAVAIAAGR